VPASLTIRAEAEEVRRASAWLESTARAQRVPPEQIVRLDHCLDEALANVMRHGGPTAFASPIRLALEVQRGDGWCSAELLVADEGIAFDPSCLMLELPPRPATLAQAEPGGLGLLMIRSFADDLSYQRSEGVNQLTMIVSWPSQTT
jgi:serine/threonine-protein kinase RsbW